MTMNPLTYIQRAVAGILRAGGALFHAKGTGIALPINLGEFRADTVTDATYLRAMEINPWVYRCVRRLATCAASVPIRVERRQRDGSWEDAGEQVELARLLDYVNADDNWVLLMEATVSCLALHGNAYWLLLRSRDTDKLPNAIQLLRPDRVKPIAGVGKRSGRVAGYRHEIGVGQWVDYTDVDVVHFRQYSPTGGLLGQGAIRALETTINTASYTGRFNEEFMRRGGIPPGVLQGSSPLTEEQKRQLRDDWASWRRPENAGVPLVLGSDLTFTVVGTRSPDEMAATDVPARLREEICAAFGVPPATVGIFEYANYANSVEQRKMLWTETICPEYLSPIASQMDEQLCTLPWPGGPYRVVFDTSGVDAMQEDLREQAELGKVLVESGLMTRNEVRERFGWGEPLPWGDDYWAPLSTIIVATGKGGRVAPPAAPATAPAAQPGAESEGQEEGQEAKAQVRLVARAVEAEAGTSTTLRRLSTEARTALYKRYNAQRDHRSDRLAEIVRGWYDDLAETMTANLAAQKALASPHRVKDPRVDVLLFDVDEAADALTGAIMPEIEAMYAETGQQAIADLGLDLAFSIQNARAQGFLRGRTFEMRSIAERAQRRARETIEDGMREGETITALTERVREWARAGREQYAENVARTETGIALNGASLEGYRQAAVGSKEWLSIIDERSRPEHAMLNAKVIGIDELFDVNGIPAECPGDPNLPAEEICQCRCTIAPVIEE